MTKNRFKGSIESGGSRAPSQNDLAQLVGLYNQGRLRDALALGATLESKYPRAPALHNILGVVNARLGQLDTATRHYRQALKIRPDYAEVRNNLGNALSGLGKYSEAISSFKKALRQMPDYVAAHNNLGNALHKAGRLEKAVASYTAALKLKPDYAEAHNNLGNVFVDLGKPREALASFALAIQYEPGLTQAHSNIGNTLRSMGHYDEAVKHFARAIELAPAYAPAYVGLGNTLNDQGLHQQAIDRITQGIRLDPNSAAALNDLGNALSDSGKHEEAVASYAAALKIDPAFAEVHSNLGNALCEFGSYDEATKSYGEALRLKPEFAEAHYNLSKIKRFSTDDAQFAAMLERLARPDISESELMYLSFALGKVYEDVGEIDKSFRFLLQGNRLRKKDLDYDIRLDQVHFETIKSLFAADAWPKLPLESGAGASHKKPVFIVGLPRSGTTLTEQILASHSTVFGAGELQTAGRVLTPYIKGVEASEEKTVSTKMLTELRDVYLGELDALGRNEPIITDKMPANFKWVGFLLSAMPGAKIINLQRDPAASCWSMFKMLFSGNGYTNDLADLAEYYHLYADLMDFWRQKFPGQIYDLNYEALTENQEAETRKLLDFCGLPWEEACLEFHKTKRMVRTPSSKQVRQKMYTGSSAAWRRYEAHLEPLLSILNRKD